MLGELNASQVEDMLKTQAFGRIGCHADGVTYVVPVNYVYEESYIYAHSGLGMKIDIMRKNPDVCFEVDTVKSIVNWQSVIGWGKFEEITNIDEKQLIMQKLIDKIMPLANHDASHPSHGITSSESDIGNTVELVIYRILLTKKTGRFEKTNSK